MPTEVYMPPRLWPMRPPPIDGELLSSWLNRTAVANGMAPYDLRRFIADGVGRKVGEERVVGGRHLRGAGGWQGSCWTDIAITAQEAEWVASCLGSTASMVMDGTLMPAIDDADEDFVRRMVAANRKVVRPEIRSREIESEDDAFTMFCPECLSGDGDPWFRRLWRTHLAVRCVDHGLRLAWRCGQCRRAVLPHASRHTRCQALYWNCGFDLRLSPRMEATPTEIRLQRDVLAILADAAAKTRVRKLDTKITGHSLVNTALAALYDEGKADVLRLLADLAPQEDKKSRAWLDSRPRRRRVNGQ